MLKTSRHPLTFFTSTPTLCYAVSRFDFIKSLSRDAFSVVQRNVGLGIDESSVRQSVRQQDRWQRYRQRLVQTCLIDVANDAHLKG